MDNNTSFLLKLSESQRFERFLEIIPGATTWSIFILLIVSSFIYPIAVVYFVILYDMLWFFRSIHISWNTILAYFQIKEASQIDWLKRCKMTRRIDSYLEELEKEIKKIEKEKPFFRSNFKFLLRFLGAKNKKIYFEYKFLQNEIDEFKGLKDKKHILMDWEKVYHMCTYPTFKEELETLEPAVEALKKSSFPLNRVIFASVGEERDKERFIKNSKVLTKKYADKRFYKFLTPMHPKGLPNEGKVKGAAVSWAVKNVRKTLLDEGISDEHVIVSSLDSDTQIHSQFLACLTYKFITNPNRHRCSFQPIPLFYNNIWDTPAPMRVMAFGSSFWQMIESMRSYRLRNFAGHCLSLKALEEVDYWDRYSIVEDGRQYWRAYFAFDGDYLVIPIFVPIYNDAVLSNTYFKTLKAQYLQRRRWYWGVSDFPMIIINSIRNKKIPLGERLLQVFRYFEGMINLATASLILAFIAWLPLYVNKGFGEQMIAHNLPILASRLLTIAVIGLAISVWTNLILLPPRPKKYGISRHITMVIQWIFLPPITICLSSFPAIEAQTRLMIKKYLSEFTVTEKIVKKKE